MGRETSFVLFLAVIPVVLTGLYAMKVYAELPEHVAIHWDWEGSPNGWASRTVLLSSFILFVSFLNVAVIAAPWIPLRFVRFPHESVGLSLSGFQRELRARLRVGLSGGLIWMSWSALGALDLMVTQAIPARAPVFPLSPGRYTLGVLLATGMFLAWLYSFMKPPAQRMRL